MSVPNELLTIVEHLVHTHGVWNMNLSQQEALGLLDKVKADAAKEAEKVAEAAAAAAENVVEQDAAHTMQAVFSNFPAQNANEVQGNG